MSPNPYEPPRLTTHSNAAFEDAALRDAHSASSLHPVPTDVAAAIAQILAILGEECGPEGKGRLAWSQGGATPHGWVLSLTLPEATPQRPVSGFMLRIASEVDPHALAQLAIEFDAPMLED